MQPLRDFFQNQKNLIPLLVLLFFALALPIGLYLVKSPQTFFSSASGQLIQIAEGNCIKTVDNNKVATCTTIPLKLTNPFNLASTSPSSASSSSPSPSSTSQNTSPSPVASVVGNMQSIKVKEFTGTAIQTALNTIKQTGGSVYLPAGTYLITEKIRLYSNTTIFGDGMDTTHIKFASAVNGDVMANDSSAGQENITIRDLSLDGPGHDGYNSGNCCNGVPYGLKLENLNNAFVINVSVNNFPSHGIYVGYKLKSGEPKGVYNTRITGCKANNNGGVGIYLVDTDNVIVDNCTVQNNGDIQPIDGITLGPDNGSSVRNSKILNNTVTNNRGNGIGLASCHEAHKDAPVHNIAVCGNTADPNDYAGLRQHKCNDGVYGNIFINNNDGGEFDNTGNGEILTNPASACDIPSSFSLPSAPVKPTAMGNWMDFLSKIKNPFDIRVYALGLATELNNSPYKDMLVSYWKMDEGSGTSVADTNFQSATGTGTAINTTVVDGKFGKARQINGTGSYISIPNYPEFGDAKMSVAGWVKPTAFTANAAFFNQPEGTSLQFAGSGDGTVQCIIKPIKENVENTITITSTTKLTLNTWNHVACTYDDATVKLYLNGAQSASADFVGWVNKHFDGQPVLMGKKISSGESLTGVLDDFAYWNRGLSSSEIASLYNNGLGTTISGTSGTTASSTPLASATSSTTASSTPLPSPTTNSYRLAETQAGLASAAWVSLSGDAVVTNFTISSTPGVKQIWVEFKNTAGQSVTDYTATFELLAPTPTLTGINCTLDITNKNLKVLITGSNMGSANGTLSANGSELQVLSWSDTSVSGLLTATSSLTSVGQKYTISLKRSDGTQSSDQTCQVNASTISLGARLVCREAGHFDISPVKVTIAPFEDPTKTVEETVSIDKDGTVQGLKTKLQSGQQYIISIKSPFSLRRNSTFTAQEGTSVINAPDGKPFILPIGDIAPTSSQDGQINALDRSELVRQWKSLSSSPSAVLTGDFNRDSQVNSIDWACMRYDYNSSDDQIGSTGSSYTRGVNVQTGEGSAVFSY